MSFSSTSNSYQGTISKEPEIQTSDLQHQPGKLKCSFGTSCHGGGDEIVLEQKRNPSIKVFTCTITFTLH